MSEPDVKVEVHVNGSPFTRWTSVDLTLSMESMANTFNFSHVETPDVEALDFGVNEGDAIKIYADGNYVSAGYVDIVTASETSEDGLTFTVGCRSYAGDLIDCSAQHAAGEWSEATIDTITRDLLQPFGVRLTVSVTATARAALPFRRVTIEPGETVAEVLRRMSRLRGLLFIAEPDGSLLLTTPADTVIPGRLKRGVNIISGAKRTGDARERYSEYRALGQTTGDAAWRGAKAAKREGNATDPQVSRHRPLVFSADGGEADLEDRAAWERNTRAGRARTAAFPVDTWYDPAGSIWRPNRLIDVQHGKLSIRGQCLISSVDLTLDRRAGSRGVVNVVSPSAYDPERAPKTRSNRRMWAAWE